MLDDSINIEAQNALNNRYDDILRRNSPTR